MTKQINMTRAAMIIAAAIFSLSLLAPSVTRAETSAKSFQAPPQSQRMYAKDCRTDTKAARETHKRALLANDKAHATAVKAANDAYEAAVRTAAQTRKAALEAARALTNKNTRKAAKLKAEENYKAAVKTAKNTQKGVKEAAVNARKAANKNADQARDASLKPTGPCVKGASTINFLERFGSFFHF